MPQCSLDLETHNRTFPSCVSSSPSLLTVNQRHDLNQPPAVLIRSALKNGLSAQRLIQLLLRNELLSARINRARPTW